MLTRLQDMVGGLVGEHVAQHGAAERNRGTGPAPVPVLEWVTPPPASAETGKDYVATWQGGAAPYVATITGPVNLNDQDASDTSMTLNVDGTNQPVGDYHWSVKDASGQEITGTTNVHPKFYVGFRKQGVSTTTPDRTAPFGWTDYGQQTLDLVQGSAPFGVTGSKYTWGGTNVISGGTTGAVAANSDHTVAVMTKVNDYTFTLDPVGKGQTIVTLRTASGDAIGTLTVNVT